MEQETKTSIAPSRSYAGGSSRARSVVMVGLVVAITAVCAWVTVPLGPVPFTLQMFAITFAICTLTPKQAIAAIYAYVALGAIGLPVFSGMRGGLGVLAGPTGGFLLGYLIGVPLAVLFLYAVRRILAKRAQARVAAAQTKAQAKDESGARRPSASTRRKAGILYTGIVPGIAAGVIFTACAYIVGCIQYTFITGLPLSVAIATCVLPFIVADAIKIVVAAVCANRVSAAIGK